MADNDVNEDLLDYEEEENTEQVKLTPGGRRVKVDIGFILIRLEKPLRMGLTPRRRGLSRVTTSPSTAVGSGTSC